MTGRKIHDMPPRISVLMPTFNQASSIRRAIHSLLSQTLPDWELVIVDDGSTDNTPALLDAHLTALGDTRIRYHRLEENRGLGAALNVALALARAPLIAYLPSDDQYYREHLASLVSVLDAHPEAALASSGIRQELRAPGKGVQANDTPSGQLEGFPLQLVQVMHRRTDDRWMERAELVTDDLERMFWHALRERGAFVETGRVTCQWIDHPAQHHKLIQEPFGGLNTYRSYYHVRQPLRFHATTGNLFDEVNHYRRFRDREDTPFAQDGLKILLVGELAFNPERVLALEERGHKLYGLWTPNTHWFNTVGPLPFGHVEDISREGWRESLARIRPDIIYAQLNWIAIPFAHEVLTGNHGIPFVWHFKEGPFDCIANGTFSQLVDLYTLSDGQIYGNSETRDWFETIIPGISRYGQSFILDGDLPKRDWLTSDRSPRLSETDGKIHTVIPGGPTGIPPSLVAGLAHYDIHLHLYGEVYRSLYKAWVDEAQQQAGDRLHLHPQVDQEHWVSEFSQYDAGWLHQFKSENEGDLHRVNWSDLNYPARIPTLAAAGVPSIQYDNSGSLVAMQSLTRALDIGMFYKDAGNLAEQLHDTARMQRLRESTWRQRDTFTFDAHADDLIAFFRRVIQARISH